VTRDEFDTLNWLMGDEILTLLTSAEAGCLARSMDALHHERRVPVGSWQWYEYKRRKVLELLNTRRQTL